MSFVVGLSSFFLVVIGFLFSLCSSPSQSDWRQISDSGSQVFRWSDSDSAGDEFEPVHIVEPRDEPVEGAEDGAGVQDAGVVAAAGLSSAPPSDSPRLDSGSGVQMILVALSKVSHSPIFPVPVLRSLRRMWY